MDYVTALENALAHANIVAPERISGCGRVYVVPAKEHKKGIKAAAKKLGVMYLDSAYGTDKGVIYVGYDNADGRALARGTAIVASLKAVGISCYRDEVGD